MAGKIVRTSIFQCGKYEVIVNFKTIKNFRYRFSNLSDNIIELSVPYSLSDAQVCETIGRLYPKFQKLEDRILCKDYKTIGSPTRDEYLTWAEKTREMIPWVEKETGLKCYKYTFRYMTTRWGSCSVIKKHISLNSALASLPMEYTHYVLVHELCHLLHADHSTNFWMSVENYFPDYRRIVARLRKIVLK